MKPLHIMGMVVAAAGVLVTGLAAAQTLDQPPSTGGSTQKRAAVGDLGMAIMSAVVSPTGGLIRGEGAAAATEISGYPGNYEVRFGRDVTQCAFAVTGTSNRNYNLLADYRSGTPDGIFIVSSYTKDQTAQRSGFSLIVYCGR